MYLYIFKYIHIYVCVYICIHIYACVLSDFSCVRFFMTYELLPAKLLCPWDSPGKNTGVGCHALLQGIFPTQGSNPYLLYLLHCRRVLYPLGHLGSPYTYKCVFCVCVCVCKKLSHFAVFPETNACRKSTVHQF